MAGSICAAVSAPSLRRVEYHMGTAITLGSSALAQETADGFFSRIEELESRLSRFRPDSDLSLLATGKLTSDTVDRSVREVLGRCADMRRLTDGCFEHEPRRASADLDVPLLDPNALAKGWIIEEAAITLRLDGSRDFFVNAGGDVLVNRPPGSTPWRIGVQHPTDRAAILGVVEMNTGAVATSGTYERGPHIRSADVGDLASVTVVGPDLATADALATAVHSSGTTSPTWWWTFERDYGLLTLSVDNKLRWRAGGVDSQGISLVQ